MSTTPVTATLIDQAARRQLPLHQYMDRATVEWIEANRPGFTASAPPALAPSARALIEKSALPGAWMATPRLYTSIHGVRHSMRTAALAAVLAEAHGLDDADTATVVVAAAVHDCQRRHDKDDKGHGARAAIWLAVNADSVWGRFGHTATPRRIVQAATAVRLHDIPYDAFTTDDWNDHAKAESMADILKAADALDRYRLPKTSWWPDARHIREPAFDRYRGLAFDLVLTSEKAHLAGASSPEAVRFALAQAGLV
ncbi:hypothetical protein [Streptomyces sp. NPDC054865]